ncbi:MAG: choline dehydrogenase [Rhodospirillaceae bacterium]|nr:choline dehydrogenase [Rhodospirillaceae bacterium]MBT4491486.1 choline dehydrogenase [Rhodospirillaceae bacterium]MBT5195451.1 choline dehydrogenase [Rhodospirillaceae bacterium]MBT5896669.1 choline dehydrogenase [Rhodospirillaceae bacterium]
MDVPTYDYIVVGAGSAGSVVANRLSANPDNRVLLLEAGPASNPWSRIPIGYAKLIKNPAANWCYSAEPEANTNGRKIAVPRGRLLGGSSSINGLVFVRGQAQDFDTWAQLGNKGWSYADVLPHFKNLESYDGGEDTYRGRSGPLRVTDPDEPGLLYESLIAAAGQIGIPHNPDYNGATQEGIAMSQATISNGRRMSTAYCFLDPIRHRGNLTIETDALTSALVLDGKRCTGVRYAVKGQPREARAGREVVISAGTINSPQLLELSGIGQPERLQNLGMEVHHALKGVGENLRDHFAPRTRWEIGAPGVTYNDRGSGLGLIKQAMRYLFLRKGMLGIPAAPIRAFVRSRDGLEAPDSLLGVVPMLYEPGYKLSKMSGITCYAHPMRPDSTGHIHITSADPRKPPAINFNFLSSPQDAEITVRAVRIVRALMNAPAMAALQTRELAPGTAEETDDEILDWVKATAETTYHPVGTCKMGSDANAVVDERLRVRGLKGLRVADASIMPTLTSGNTNAPAIMIGEKAAAMILEDAA